MLGRSSSASQTQSGPEHDLEQRDQANLRGRDQARADREQREPEPDLTDAERRQPADVAGADLAGAGEGEEGHHEDRLREAGGGRHGDVAAEARDHDHRREGERHEEGETVPGEAALAGGPEHERDADERQGHREGRAAGDRLAERHPGEQCGDHRREGQDEQDARHARVVERGDEAARRDRDAPRHREARDPDGPEGLEHPAALGDRHVGEQGGGGERRAAEDLGRRVERELALEDAGGRPGDRGESDVDLPAALSPRLLERHRRGRHGV